MNLKSDLENELFFIKFKEMYSFIKVLIEISCLNILLCINMKTVVN